ncbi:ead/Ea22-like family protein [Escherichia coli]|nr:ead/Ea22-like family protein [Escherichia coli]EJE0803577.1 ead/Ea22-like family protein [Escherichia coli]ELW7701856.1 ead/Ea22-like family protein [Escherichia coli]
MSNIDKRALRHSAESIICILENIAGFEPSDIDGDSVELRFETEDGFDTGCDVSIVDQCQKTADVVRALLDELERNQQYIKSRDQENEDIALTVGKLRVELEGKDSKIANLTAERDALREGEMGDARHSNTRAAADIYFQLVEECEIPAGGSLVEYVDDMREKLEAAEKRIAELEAREILLPERSSMLHRTDFHDDYQTVMAYKVSEVIAAIRAAGIRIKGE